MPYVKRKPVKSQKIRAFAKGKDCTVQIPGICNYDPSTSVLAHVARGSGIAQKCDDIHAAVACSSCHDAIDYRTNRDPSADLLVYAYEGMIRTQILMLEEELIEVPSAC